MHHILVCKVTLIAAAVTRARGIWTFFLASVLSPLFFSSRKSLPGRGLSSRRMWHLNWHYYLLRGQWIWSPGRGWCRRTGGHCGAAHGDSDQRSPRCWLAALTSAQSWEISWGPAGRMGKETPYHSSMQHNPAISLFYILAYQQDL